MDLDSQGMAHVSNMHESMNDKTVKEMEEEEELSRLGEELSRHEVE